MYFLLLDWLIDCKNNNVIQNLQRRRKKQRSMKKRAKRATTFLVDAHVYYVSGGWGSFETNPT